MTKTVKLVKQPVIENKLLYLEDQTSYVFVKLLCADIFTFKEVKCPQLFQEIHLKTQ